MYNDNMITSSKNDFIKDLKKLKSEKDILVLDNPKLILEAQKEGWQILYTLKTENIHESYPNETVVSENVLKNFTNTQTSQGVVSFI